MAFIKDYTDSNIQHTYENAYWIPHSFLFDKLGFASGVWQAPLQYGVITFAGFTSKAAREATPPAKPIHTVKITVDNATYNAKVKAAVQTGLTLEQAMAKVAYELAADNAFFEDAVND